MLKTSFYYDLPSDLIARVPARERTGSRLLVVPESGEFIHSQFFQCLDFLKPGDLLVFNNTKVIPARLFGRKETGGAVEIMLERLSSSHSAIAQVRCSKSPKPGARIFLEDQTCIEVCGRDDDFFVLESSEPWLSITDRLGHMPLPPYIDREDESSDRERYQTVYAKEPGAMAAPTAGLHFDQELLERIKNSGIDMAEVTLHVGAGTYQPVRAERVEEHQMHSEWICIDENACDMIRAAKAKGGRVIAVGTTALRTLETAALKSGDDIQSFTGDTDIFIYPGYQFRCVDALITNFHLPESTLLMLVSALSGYSRIKSAYQEAIQQRYRFFSYGDAMLLERNSLATQDMPL